MRKLLSTLIFTLIISSIVFSLFYIFQYSNKFVIKGTILIPLSIVYALVLFFIKIEYIIYSVIILSFLNIPMTSIYTSSTNLLIIYSAFVLLSRSGISKKNVISLGLMKKNSVTLPLIFIIGSYTISFLFVKAGWKEHLIFYQSIICASILIWMIVGTIKEKQQIISINKIMLVVLISNLCFSLLFIFFPQIDPIRADFLSLYIFTGEPATRLQGLSFRGESYGEYLMICALWLFAMLLKDQLKKGKAVLWVITICAIIALILTRLRGPNIVFLVGLLLFLITSRSITLPKKLVVIIGIVLTFTITLFTLSTFTDRITLLDRLYNFSDQSEKIGSIPKTRYYPWVSGFQYARMNNFMGVGPSLAPSANGVSFTDVVSDNASGSVTVWPHNIVLIILCTVGIYGLLSYLFLLYRAIRLRKIFKKLEPYLKYAYSSYLFCFIMFLIEAQKYDGSLRYPGSNFYFIFILMALVFTSENMVLKEGY